MPEYCNESDLMSFLHSKQFEDMLRNPDKVGYFKGYKITGLRPENKREEFTRLYTHSDGNSEEYEGDIILDYNKNEWHNPFIIKVGAHFDVKDEFLESFLRKISYDKIMGYRKAHQIDIPSINGSSGTIEDCSPYIRIDSVGNVGKISSGIKKKYEKAKQWLELIDSKEFENLKYDLAGNIDNRFDEMVNKLMVEV